MIYNNMQRCITDVVTSKNEYKSFLIVSTRKQSKVSFQVGEI
jgi:hypothetical protein